MSEFSRNLAFIIGINNYTNGISPLQNAVNDAKKLVEILREKHEYQVWVCLDEVATLNNLNKLLEKILPEQVGENDRLLFYFAGHGIALNGDDGPAGYLIPQGAKLGDVQTYLPMAKLQESLNKLPCRHFLGILDCCFAGAFRWSSNRDLLIAPEVIHKERYDRFITDPAWQVITSAASDQKALDAFALNSERRQRGKHSPFAAALIEALAGKADIYPPATNGKPSGDGVITATELYLYLRDAVEPATEGNRQRQTPGIHPLKKHDKGEYIFLSPGHPLNLPPAPPLDASKNPYRGLKSFDEKHSELFFGRTELVEKLQNFVKTHPLTVVLGASGSGKSSLVKAGLIPELRKETTEQWSILEPIRPGETPLLALNNALKNAQLPEVAAQNLQQSLAMSIDTWAKNHPNSKLLLFIDQSEEIITLCQNEDERKEFFQQILKAINVHRDRLRVVLSLRSDFEPQIRDAGLKFVPTVVKVGNTVLKNRWHTGRFIVPAMTRGELREAIEKPAETRVMYFDPHELVEQLIDEVDNMPGALPLLSFALSELYLKYLKRQREAENGGITIDRALTQADYQDLGGVIQSLTQRADEEYEALVKENPAYAQIIRHVMLRMVAIGGGELARRRVPLSELEYPPEKNDLVKAVIERFTKARLLVKGEDTEGNPYVEPAHDALVRGWKRLLEWKQEEEESLLLQRRLTPAAEEWESQQQVRFLWNSNPRLDLLKKVLNSDDNWLNKVEAEFVRRSVGRKSFNTRRNWSIAIAVMLGLGTGLAFSLIGQRNAQIGQIQASRQAAKALLLPGNQQLEALVAALRAEKTLKYSRLLQLWRPEQLSSKQEVWTLSNTLYQTQERNRLQHQNPVTDIVSAQFSPDGKYIITASGDGTARVWNLQGELLTELKGHRDTLWSAKFSPDNQYIVTASADKTARVWNLQGQLLAELKGSQYGVKSVQFSPDSKYIVTASGEQPSSNNLTKITGDRTARVWNLQGQLLAELKGHQDSVQTAQFSPDSKYIVTASDDKMARVWNLQGQLLAELKGHQKKLYSAQFSPDSKYIVTASDDGTARVWNLQGQLLAELKGHKNFVQTAQFSPDSKYIVTASDDSTARVWNLNGQLLTDLKGHQGEVRGAQFSSNGKYIVTASDDSTAKVWNLNGQLLTDLKGHQSYVYSAQFSPDGRHVVTASRDGTARVWDLQNQLLADLKGHQGEVSSAQFSPDSKYIVTASDDRTARLWNLNGQFLTELKGHQRWLNSAQFSPDSKYVVTASDDGTAKIWNLNGQLLAELKGHRSIVNSVQFSPDGKYIVTASNDGTAKIWNLNGQLLAELKGHRSIVNSVQFSPDGKYIVTASVDKTARVWNLQGQLQTQLKGHQYWVRNAQFSPDSQAIITASSDGTARLWSVQGQLLTEFKGHQKGISNAQFSPDGRYILTASFDGTARLWSVQGQLLTEFKGHQKGVVSAQFSPDGKFIVTASNDRTARVWNLQGELLAELKGHQQWLHSVQFSPDGKYIVTASGDQTARIWRSPTSSVDNHLSEVCNQIRSYLKDGSDVQKDDRNLCDGIKISVDGNEQNSSS